MLHVFSGLCRNVLQQQQFKSSRTKRENKVKKRRKSFSFYLHFCSSSFQVFVVGIFSDLLDFSDTSCVPLSKMPIFLISKHSASILPIFDKHFSQLPEPSKKKIDEVDVCDDVWSQKTIKRNSTNSFHFATKFQAFYFIFRLSIFVTLSNVQFWTVFEAI